MSGIFCPKFAVTLVGAFAAGDCVAAELCTRGLNTSQIELVTILDNYESASVEELSEQISELTSQNHQNFCALYESGRFYANLSQYEKSETLLEQALNVSTTVDLSEFAVENLLGFTELSRGNFDAAVSLFEDQSRRAEFELLSQDTRMKVLNNMGYTYIQLGRFEEARVALQLAIELGSERAGRNMEVLLSLVSAAVAGDINSRGVFAAIVGTVDEQEELPMMLDELSRQLEIDVSELRSFRTGNGMYAVTLGSYKSYLGAQRDLDLALASGLADAFVTTLIDWNPVDSLQIGSE